MRSPVLVPEAERGRAGGPILLTVQLEDYFHVGAFERLIPSRNWSRFETRLEQNTAEACELFDRCGVKGTFFVLGWVADQFPELVRNLVDRGHEVATQGYYHRTIRQMDPGEFEEDLLRSKESVERAAGTRVHGHRIPHFLSEQDLWALDVIAKHGYRYDSSLRPLLRSFGSQAGRRFIHEHTYEDNTLMELPISSLSYHGYALPIAGGNFYRQIPHTLMKKAVKRWTRKYDAPFVMYFHVWELDPDQPRISAGSLFSRIRHYRKLDKMAWVLRDYFKNYEVSGIGNYLGVEQEVLPVSDPVHARITPRLPNVRADAASILTSSSAAERTALSVVVPCFNEQNSLRYLANTLESTSKALAPHFAVEFVFVDDGSTDDTWGLLRELFAHWGNCTFVQHKVNQGVAASILTGLRNATSETVCSIDCDCTYDPHEILKMVPLLTDGISLVTASPYHPDGSVRNVPPWRLSLSWGCSFLYRLVLPGRLSTFTSCFRVYRRATFSGMPVSDGGFLGVAEMLGRAVLQGHRVVEYPTTLEVRLLGHSKMKTFRSIVGHLRLLARLAIERLTSNKDSFQRTKANQTIDTNLTEKPITRMKTA